MYKVSELVVTTGRDGSVGYGVPRHKPMTGWTDYDLVKVAEVDFEGQTQEEFEKQAIAKSWPHIQKELEREKAGSTVHAPGCDCGFCRMGFTG